MCHKNSSLSYFLRYDQYLFFVEKRCGKNICVATIFYLQPLPECLCWKQEVARADVGLRISLAEVFYEFGFERHGIGYFERPAGKILVKAVGSKQVCVGSQLKQFVIFARKFGKSCALHDAAIGLVDVLQDAVGVFDRGILAAAECEAKDLRVCRVVFKINCVYGNLSALRCAREIEVQQQFLALVVDPYDVYVGNMGNGCYQLRQVEHW